MKEGTYEVW